MLNPPVSSISLLARKKKGLLASWNRKNQWHQLFDQQYLAEPPAQRRLANQNLLVETDNFCISLKPTKIAQRFLFYSISFFFVCLLRRQCFHLSQLKTISRGGHLSASFNKFHYLNSFFLFSSLTSQKVFILIDNFSVSYCPIFFFLQGD